MVGAEAVRRAQGRQAVGVPRAAGAERAFSPDRLGQCLRLQPAADHGAGQLVGLRVRRCSALAGASPADLAAVARGMMVCGPAGAAACQRVHDLRRRRRRRSYLKLDRERAQALGSSISDIFSALQTALGGTYTNDFNLFGRTWQVKVQADAADRGTVNDIFRVRVRSSQRRSGAAAGGGQCRADHRALLDRALQQPALGGAERRAGAGLFLGRGDRRHGDARQGDPARRLRLRMDRHGAAGEGGERPDRLHPGARRGVRLPLPGRPLREHGHPGRRPAVGRRSACSAPWLALFISRPRQQHLRPDRHRRADRARRQERHPDHRVRDGRARQGQDIVTAATTAAACASAP